MGGQHPHFGRPIFDPRLRPRRVHWGCNGELSTLAIQYQLGAGAGDLGGRLRPGQAEERLGVGDGVVLTQPVGRGGAFAAAAQELFRGTIGRVRPVIEPDPDREAFEAVAYGPEIRLRSKVVSGQWCKTVARDDAELTGAAAPAGARREALMATDLAVIFNEGGLPNATGERFRLASIHDHDGVSTDHNQCRAFEPPGRKVHADGSQVAAMHWTACAALRSLVEYVDDYDVVSPETDWKGIQAVLGDVPLGEVVAEAMDLLEALRAILLPIGFGFALEPWARPVRWSGPIAPSDSDKHRLIVFPLRGTARRRCPYLAPVVGGNVSADSPEGQRAQVQRLEFVRDAAAVANAVTVIGDLRRTQVALEFTSGAEARDLHPLWDTSAHDLSDWANAQGLVDPRSDPPWSQSSQETFFQRYNHGADHPLYKHVFRTFVWNEDAAFDGVVGAHPDLGGFGTGEAASFLRRPRPVRRTFLYDEPVGRARTYPPLVQLGIEGDDDAWIAIPAAPLADRAGFTILRETLHDWFPYDRHDVPQALRDAYGSSGDTPVSYLTALHNALGGGTGPKLRLRLLGSIECDQAAKAATDPPAGGLWPFRAERVIRAEDRFAWRDVTADPLALTSERRDTRDDRPGAAEYAAAAHAAGAHCTGGGRLVLRGIARAFRPGDAVPRTQGRRVNLSVDGPHRQCWPIITAVDYDFETGGKTELRLERPAGV